MKSRIYRGNVMHARHRPVQHRFNFPFYFYAIDLDELPMLHRTLRGFNYNRWGPVSLYDRDYLRGEGAFRHQLSEFIDSDEVKRVVLITVPRFITRVFNPVSFYYVLREDDSPACMLAEVNNTFGERHLYRLKTDGSFPVHTEHDKSFHVSPFNNMNGHYAFTFSAPEDTLRIGIKLVRDGETVMDAVMQGKGYPLTTRELWKTVLRHPFAAGLTMPRIIWQAALLRYKHRLPVYKKPAPSSPMTLKARV